MESQNFDFNGFYEFKSEMDEIDYIEEFYSIVTATREAALESLSECSIDLFADVAEDAAMFSTSFTFGMAQILAEEYFELDDEYETLIEYSLSFKEYGAKGFIASTLLKFIWQELFNVYQSYFNSDENGQSDDIYFAS